MIYKIIEFKGDETEWIVAKTMESALECAKGEDLWEGVEDGSVVPRELTDTEAKELKIRSGDAGIDGDEDKYEAATDYLDREIESGRELPFLFMATYF